MTRSEEFVVVTGGLGFIGSHTVIQLLQSNYKVIIFDNLINSKIEALERIKTIVKMSDDDDRLSFYNVDIRNFSKLYSTVESIILRIDPLLITSLIHFAGLKSVSDSVLDPISYFDTNFVGSLNLLKLLNQENGSLLPNLKSFIFSSSATVYGDVKSSGFEIPIKESTPVLLPTSPYGESKLMVEKALNRFINSGENNHLKVGILRYFNPIGAHHSGLIGEDSLGTPTNLLPVLGNIAIQNHGSKNLKNVLNVFGDDYDTNDGTPIRDYIHIEDLSNGHLLCLKHLKQIAENKSFYREWNLGTGNGLTVLELINIFNKNVKSNISYKLTERRPGDVEILLANPTRANKELNWSCKRTVDDACKDLWKWLRNLHGI